MSINEKKLTKALDDLGFQKSHVGTEYIKAGARIMAKDRNAMVCKDVYPTLGGGTRSGFSRVERSMRDALQAAMRNPNWHSVWTGMGGWGKPTNKELLHRLARECSDED